MTRDGSRTPTRPQVARPRLDHFGASLPGILYQVLLAADGEVSFPYVSQGALEIFGIPPELAMAEAERIMDAVHPDDLPGLMDAMAESARTLRPYSLTHRMVHPDGTVRWVTANSVPSRMPDGSTLWNGVALDVTESKRREAEIEESEERFRTLFRKSPDPLFIWDMDDRVLDANDAACRMLQYSREELLDLRLADIQAPSVRGANGEVIRSEMARMGRPFEGVDLRSDGTKVDVEVVTVPITLHGEKVALSAVRDISESKQARRSLESALERLRAHIDNSPLATVEWDSRGRIITWSARSEELFGLDRSEALGKNWHDWRFVHEEDGDEVARQITELYTGQRRANTIRNRNYDSRGNVLHCRWHNSALLDEHGEVASILSLVEDVTEHMRVQQELERSEARLRAMFEHMGSGVVVYEGVDHGRDFRILDMNPRAERITRTPREQLIGRLLLDMFPAMKHSALPAALKRVLETGEPEHLPPFYYADDTREGWRENRLYRLPTGAVVAIFDDVSERMRTQEELVSARDEAETASRAKSDFLANMSHELRTPLNGLLGILQMMERTVEDEQTQEYTGIAIQACWRMTRLVDDILDLTRIDMGRLRLKSCSFDLYDLMHGIRELFRSAATQQGLELRMHVDPATPQMVEGDDARLQQILNNLVGNALKFTDRGQVACSVRALPFGPEGSVRLLFTVEDTGVGIPLEELEELCRSFSQAESGFTREHQGAGLGLAMVRRLVELMGGTLCVDSEPSSGSAFHVSLPFGGTTHPEPDTDEPAREPDMVLPRLRVLVVDDDRINRLALSRLLERMGQETGLAAGGRQAIETLREQPFDLVLMDVQMPGMDGLEATRRIRAAEAGHDRARIPIVAVTAYASQEERAQFLAEGMDEHIAKPVDQSDLAALLSRHGGGGAPDNRPRRQ